MFVCGGRWGLSAWPSKEGGGKSSNQVWKVNVQVWKEVGCSQVNDVMVRTRNKNIGNKNIQSFLNNFLSQVLLQMSSCAIRSSERHALCGISLKGFFLIT